MSLPKLKVGSMRDLNEALVKKGFIPDRRTKTGFSFTKKTGERALIKLVKTGTPAKKVNIRISPTLTQTRQFGTASVYRISKLRKMKIGKKVIRVE